MPGEPKLVDDDVLAGSAVAANRAMNRERRLAGRDGYSRVLGLDLVELLTAKLTAAGSEPVRWLDLCCGSGRALFDAAKLRPEVEITGVDLVGYFGAPPRGRLTFPTASIASWEPAHVYDLITCVHGLHYVGDKLGTLTRAAPDSPTTDATAGSAAPGIPRRACRSATSAPTSRRARTTRGNPPCIPITTAEGP